MVSVLIPIYNFDVRPLVRQLVEDLDADQLVGEIVCLDDCSDTIFKQLNHELSTYSKVRYMESETNLGRSAIRNTLYREAKYEWLLFLDCDMMVRQHGVFKRYLSAVDKGVKVVYGGTSYGSRPKDSNLLLHWIYGSERECVPALKRNKNPYGTFKTNNFFIHKSVIGTVGFDETVKGYGHEDTLFALELKRQGIALTHIENTLEHLGLEQKEVFLQKQRNAIENLAVLYQKGQLGDEIRLIKVYHKAKRFGLLFLVKLLYLKDESRLLKNLISNAPQITNLDRLKLRWFLNLIEKR